MIKKVCNSCNIEKNTSEFYNYKSGKFGVMAQCKECKKEYVKKYKKNNKEKIKKYFKNRKVEYDPNAFKVCCTCKVEKYTTEFDKHKGGTFGVHCHCKECRKKYNKNIYKNNKEYVIKRGNNYINKRRKTDTLFKLTCNIRNLIRISLKNGGYGKNTKTFKILGCSFEDFKAHIESQFEPWMDWSKYGLYNGELNYGFDLDHIIPISKGVTEEERIKLNHYTNFQPLCSKVNRDIKRNKINY